tara:strand:- start:1 stop:402 length:402 start_codon:yes stop_codon:yes gene_type:complete
VNPGIADTLRHHLHTQRTKLETYLQILEAQEDVILHGDIDTLEYHMALERDAIRDLEALGRVIQPMRDILPDLTAPELDRVYDRVVRQHQRNRELLAQRREQLAREIESIHVPRGARSIYRQRDTGTMLNVVL